MSFSFLGNPMKNEKKNYSIILLLNYYNKNDFNIQWFRDFIIIK